MKNYYQKRTYNGIPFFNPYDKFTHPAEFVCTESLLNAITGFLIERGNHKDQTRDNVMKVLKACVPTSYAGKEREPASDVLFKQHEDKFPESDAVNEYSKYKKYPSYFKKVVVLTIIEFNVEFIREEKEELFIKENIKNPVLKELVNRLENEYGCLLTNVGCITDNGNWLSVKAMATLISRLDNDLKESFFE